MMIREIDILRYRKEDISISREYLVFSLRLRKTARELSGLLSSSLPPLSLSLGTDLSVLFLLRLRRSS